MSRIVVFDYEYLAKAESMGRMWSGADDPDPVLVQIGTVLFDLQKDAMIVDQAKINVTPQDRNDAAYPLDPYFTDLTGTSKDDILTKGVDLETALGQLDTFSQSVDLWSWGKDELFALGISCLVCRIAPPMRVARFGKLKNILRLAGMADVELRSTNSGELAEYYGVGDVCLSKHDALDDAISLARALHYLMTQKRLPERDFSLAS